MTGTNEQRRGKIDRRAWLALGAVGVAGWAGGRLLSRAVPIGRDMRGSAAVGAILNDTDGPASGPANASLRLAVFSDYRCAACRHAFPALDVALAQDGEVRVLFRDWPIFGALSERAARVALASERQGLYPAVHRGLMTASGAFDDAMLRAVVQGAGGDWSRLLADMEADRERIDDRLRRMAAEAGAIGLPGTPGYLAGPLLQVGAIDAADFARLFARARRLAMPAPGS